MKHSLAMTLLKEGNNLDLVVAGVNHCFLPESLPISLSKITQLRNCYRNWDNININLKSYSNAVYV